MQKIEYSKEDTQGHENLVVGGEQFPESIETNRNMHRLYSHPLCPFAERARLAFRAAKIKHQIVHVDMSKKPQWFEDQGGNVPVLETPEGELIPESDIVVDYAINYSEEGKKLLPHDLVERAKLKLYIKKLEDGFMLPMYMGLLKGEEENIKKLTEKLKKIEEDLSKNDEGNNYIGNQKTFSLADIMISPILLRSFYAIDERLPTVNSIHGEDFPHIKKYLEITGHDPDLAAAYGCRYGFLNFIINKQKDLSLKLYYPFDDTPTEDSQSLKELYIKNGLTDKPRRNERHIRLYGHHLCPFVQRALLALKAKQVEYQFVGADLTHKNKWHLAINNGLVPILELPDGKIIPESLDIVEWLQENIEDGVNLYPGDEDNKQKIKDTIKEVYDKTVYFIVLAIKKEEREGSPDKFHEILQWTNDRLPEEGKGIYFNGEEQETMADLMLLPFIHCAFLIQHTQLKEKFYDTIDFEQIPRLKKWYDTLFEKYNSALGEGKAFDNWLTKNIEANGPKVQLFYPLY